LAAALPVFAAFTSTHVDVMVPTAPAVYVIVFAPPLVTPAVPPGLVMLPPVIVQEYVIPGFAVTDAVRLVSPAVTGLCAVIVGVAGGLTTVTFCVPVLLAPLTVLVTLHCSPSAPVAPALNVMPLVPAPAVIVPLVIDQEYVTPV
jgi:hypothetical protein